LKSALVNEESWMKSVMVHQKLEKSVLSGGEEKIKGKGMSITLFKRGNQGGGRNMCASGGMITERHSPSRG